MSRVLLSTILLLGVCATPLWADEAEDKVKAAPNDAAVWNTYAGQNFQKVAGLAASDPAAALKKLEEMEKFIASVEVEEEAAKTMVGRINAAIGSFRERAQLAQIPIADLEKKLAENPDDTTTLRQYLQKAMAEIAPIARSEPVAADEKLQKVKAMLAKITESAKEESTKTAIEQMSRQFASLENSIATGKRRAELVGKPAAPLAVEAWVNGEALTDADLKGKVVLLDFWAVWCGPCIATFPHLREWNEKYAEKGLVIIGLTSYYKYKWDEDANRAVRSQEEVSAEDEQKMLVKFAEEHDLKHRFAIQAGRDMSEYYAVSGIPHVVIIDQEGKVRMVRVGSGEKNANDISGLLAELLDGKKAE
jgi:thiol-disulfide isomerase/thioredoxin